MPLFGPEMGLEALERIEMIDDIPNTNETILGLFTGKVETSVPEEVSLQVDNQKRTPVGYALIHKQSGEIVALLKERPVWAENSLRMSAFSVREVYFE